MARLDIHCPSNIQPVDYVFVAYRNLKSECMGDYAFIVTERERIASHMAKTGGAYSQHAHGGSCHICGAHAVYTAVFYHTPSNVYICTGLDCADKLDSSVDGSLFRKQCHGAMEAIAGKKKAQAFLEAAGIGNAWAIYNNTAPLPASLGNAYSILADIVEKLVKYGSLSAKQIAFLGRLTGQIAGTIAPPIDYAAQREAARKAEQESALPFPISSDRIKIAGKVLTIKQVESDYGTMTRVLVQHVDGWKAWGSKPSIDGIEIGSTIEFYATVQVSGTDSKFGFFKRPTKARVIA